MRSFDCSPKPTGRDRPCRGRTLALVLATAIHVTSGGARSAAAQTAAEFEVERAEDLTTSRLELTRNGFYLLRMEHRARPDDTTDRVGAKLPGSLLGLDGYVSAFLEDRSASTGVGTNFELGKGLWSVGGSVERSEAHFTGAYLKLRTADVELAGGGGARDGDPVWHGGGYLKGMRWSLAIGGSLGPDEAAYSHVAATWHPAADQRGTAPGAWMTFERDGPRAYNMVVAVAHRANFGHLTSWGAYGMDQWPHEKRIEALGDVMRYFLPSIRNHERSSGFGVLAAEWDVVGGAGTLTLDARAFPLRWLHDAPRQTGSGRRDLLRELGRNAMVGWIEPLGEGAGTLLAELRLAPVVLYFEVPTASGADPYLFVQYVLRVP